LKKKLIRNSTAIAAVIISIAFFLNFGPPVEKYGTKGTFQKYNKKKDVSFLVMNTNTFHGS
jgi:hypothetical protein